MSCPVQEPNPILLYDGVCGLCNRLNQFLLKRDQHDCLRFASLQSDFGERVLRRHGANPHDLDTVYVVIAYEQPSERLLARSDAILHVASKLGGIWRFARFAKVFPKAMRDAVYDIVARNRYRVFGKYESCLMPDPRYQHKFLDF